MATRPTIFPVMCRATLLEPALEDRVSRLLSSRPDDIAGLMIHFTAIEDTLCVSGRPRFLDPGGHALSPWRDASLPRDSADEVRGALGRLVDDEALATAVENVDAAGFMVPETGFYKIALFKGCAIFSVEDPLTHALTQLPPARSAASAPSRAQICSLLLEEVESSHARLNQPSDVRRALMVWRRAHGLGGADPEAPFFLADPMDEDIISCTRDQIHD